MGFDRTDLNATVEHPAHYNTGDIECIDALKSCLTAEEYRGFCKGNVIKYLWRANNKGGVEDIHKANAYVGYLLETLP